MFFGLIFLQCSILLWDVQWNNDGFRKSSDSWMKCDKPHSMALGIVSFCDELQMLDAPLSVNDSWGDTTNRIEESVFRYLSIFPPVCAEHSSVITSCVPALSFGAIQNDPKLIYGHDYASDCCSPSILILEEKSVFEKGNIFFYFIVPSIWKFRLIKDILWAYTQSVKKL